MSNTRPLLEFLKLQQKIAEQRGTIGGSMQAARKARGLSQSETAAAMGTTQAYLSVIENGHKTPSSSTLERFISVLEDAEGGKDGEEKEQG